MNNKKQTSPLIIQKSPFNVSVTADRIEQQLRAKGVQVFARINHGEAARKAGMEMPDEELLIFGSPKVGTPLMVECNAIGIELPLKVIIWQDSDQSVIGYQQLTTTLAPYGIEQNQEVITKMQEFIANIVTTAIK